MFAVIERLAVSERRSDICAWLAGAHRLRSKSGAAWQKFPPLHICGNAGKQQRHADETDGSRLRRLSRDTQQVGGRIERLAGSLLGPVRI